MNRNLQETTSTSRSTNGRSAENNNHYSDDKRGWTSMGTILSNRNTTPRKNQTRMSHSQGTTRTTNPTNPHS